MTINPALVVTDRRRRPQFSRAHYAALGRKRAAKRGGGDSGSGKPSLAARVSEWRATGTWQTRYGDRKRRSQETSNS